MAGGWWPVARGQYAGPSPGHHDGSIPTPLVLPNLPERLGGILRTNQLGPSW